MRLSHAQQLLRHWQASPPENELLAMLAQAYTTWRPKDASPKNLREHVASLEARWNSGEAMNIKQVFEATGGRLSAGAGPVDGAEVMPGIGPFPGTH
jgi:hypothetical protein